MWARDVVSEVRVNLLRVFRHASRVVELLGLLRSFEKLEVAAETIP